LGDEYGLRPKYLHEYISKQAGGLETIGFTKQLFDIDIYTSFCCYFIMYIFVYAILILIGIPAVFDLAYLCYIGFAWHSSAVAYEHMSSVYFPATCYIPNTY
jgi:hypothetical protein